MHLDYCRQRAPGTLLPDKPLVFQLLRRLQNSEAVGVVQNCVQSCGPKSSPSPFNKVRPDGQHSATSKQLL